MINLIKILPTFFCFLILISCAEQNKNVPVEGAKLEVSSSSDDSTDESSLADSVSIEDNLSEDDNATTVYERKLTEVGDRVFFDYDKSRFKKEGVETLKRQARFLQENSNITITIEGHCDARGTREYNLALGERRAYAVKSFLTSLGIDEERISVISYGKEKLQATGNNEQAWAVSRTAVTVINP